jgi:hypothetical protein
VDPPLAPSPVSETKPTALSGESRRSGSDDSPEYCRFGGAYAAGSDTISASSFWGTFVLVASASMLDMSRAPGIAQRGPSGLGFIRVLGIPDPGLLGALADR